MPAPPIRRLDSAESAAEHIAWARSCGFSPRECARAIGWTVSNGVSWGLVTALYATEAGKILDGAGSWWCHETRKAGVFATLRPPARGVFPRVSLAGDAASDALAQCVKDRALTPIRQDHELTFMARNGLGAGLTRSGWRGE
jgi:hypothetical protein